LAYKVGTVYIQCLYDICCKALKKRVDLHPLTATISNIKRRFLMRSSQQQTLETSF